jgi:hypothetical protein
MNEAELETPILLDFIDIGHERGRREGVERGRREGVEAGRREGVEAGRREDLLELMAARGLSLTSEQRSRVEAEHNADKLLSWLRCAAVANSTDAVFVD